MRSCFLQPLIKEKSPTNKKTGETNNIFGRCHKTYLALSSENGAVSEDPNLPIDERKKIKLPYKQ